MDPLAGYPTDEELKNLAKSLEDVTLVKPAQHRLAEVFTLILRENFMNMPYRLWQGANKSNWTYHTAFVIRETAQTLGLDCVFETMGRLDALIQTPGEKPRVVLLAEWESDYRSVFGKDKELDKLWKGLSRKRYASALLLTYCPLDKYYSFVKEVVEYWQKRAVKRKYYSTLFLLVAVYGVVDSIEQFQFLRTIEIFSEEILLWNDLLYFQINLQ
jgi:hypothetical protein